MLNNSLYSSDKMDWETPKQLFNKLNEEFYFSLDVCATPINTKCKMFFAIGDQSLDRDWFGIVWMNPPYGREISKWVAKAYNESRKTNCRCVCLLPVRSDTKWWHQYVMRASEIRLLNKRLSFEGANNKAPFPVAIVIFDSTSNKPILSAMQI